MAHLLRVSLQGQLPTGEEWSVNPCWQISDFGISTTPAQVQAVATAIAAVSVPASIPATWANGTILAGCRVEARTFAGVLENQAEAIKAIPVGGGASVVHPLQTSLVQSLRTVVAGPSGRGRLYWPATGISLQTTTSRPTTAAVTNLLAGYTTYLGGIQTAIRVTFTGATLTVWSRKNNTSNMVVSTQMGDVPDVQRRRRDTLIEAYQSQVFP